MVAIGDYGQQKQELERVLASGIFDRSPSLGHVLSYICDKYFEGTGQHIGEHNIAVDVLGRSGDFDQKKNSIVRVRMHRLRERLAEYYAKEGASHPMMIEIPPGQYIPRFISTRAMPEVAVPKPAADFELATEPAQPHRLRPWMLAAAGAAALIILYAATPRNLPTTRPVMAALQPAPQGNTIRILAGVAEGTFTDGFGSRWEADRDFEGGTAVNVPPHAIRGTRDPKIYQNFRQGIFAYNIPLQSGVYELRLHFAEVYFGENNPAGFGGEGTRAFAIEMNGKTVVPNLDVTGEAGTSTAHIRAFKDVSPAQDGKLHLSFRPLLGVPFLNAIEISPGTPGHLQPIRLVMQDRTHVDPQGQVWLPDRVAVGGQIVKRHPLEGAPDPNLYAGERFGNLSYAFPVPPGRYTINLYMAERGGDPAKPGSRDGVGKRLFDASVNGVQLLRNFDVCRQAGGREKPLVQALRGLEPNHQGYLALSLVPYKEFPFVNAIEILDESR